MPPPVARGDAKSRDVGRIVRRAHALALYEDDASTLDDLREAVTILEDSVRITRRVFGGTHPLTTKIEDRLQKSRAALRALWCPRIAVFEEFCDLGW